MRTGRGRLAAGLFAVALVATAAVAGITLLSGPRYPTALAVSERFTAALLARDTSALAELAAPSTPDPTGAAQRLVAALPAGELSLDKVVLESGVGAHSAGLEVTVTTPSNGVKTVDVLLMGEVGPAALDAPDWSVVYERG